MTQFEPKLALQHAQGCSMPAPMVTRVDGGRWRVDRCPCGAEIVHHTPDADPGRVPRFGWADQWLAR